MANRQAFQRVIWIVLDSVGIGELPDAAEYGDVGRDTLGHIARSRPLTLPNLVRLGLANIKPLAHLTPPAKPEGNYGKGATVRPEKTRRPATGRWPASGSTRRFPCTRTVSRPSMMEEFEERIGRRTARQQARLRHGNYQGTRRGARAHRLSDRLHVGRQRVSDRRARRRDSRRRALPHVRDRAKASGRAEPSGPRDRAPVYRHAGKFPRAPSGGTITPSSRRGPCCSTCLPERSVPVFGVGKIHDIYNGRGVDDYVNHEKQRRRHGQAAPKRWRRSRAG